MCSDAAALAAGGGMRSSGAAAAEEARPSRLPLQQRVVAGFKAWISEPECSTSTLLHLNSTSSAQS